MSTNPGRADADLQGVASMIGTSPQSAVGALMEERRRFENWLVALEARRDSTPERVFTRVHADYTARLESVVASLTQHTEGLRTEVAALTASLTALEEEQQAARDERAESELRAHVGELAGDAWKAVETTSDARLAALADRHTSVAAELARARELLADAVRPATPVLAATAIPAAAAVVDASVQAATAVATPPSVAAVADATAAPAVPAVPAVEGAVTDEVAAPEAVPQGVPVATEPAPGRTGSFDELAFLNSVVDTPSASVERAAEPVAPPPRRQSYERRAADDAIENLEAAGSAPILGKPAKPRLSPLAANISGNNPIVLKDSSKSMDGAKTLKCADCGAMNYATEWYCERCGAELASL